MTTDVISYDTLGISPGDIYREMGYGETMPEASIRDEIAGMTSDIRQWLRPRYAFTALRGCVDTDNATVTLFTDNIRETDTKDDDGQARRVEEDGEERERRRGRETETGTPHSTTFDCGKIVARQLRGAEAFVIFVCTAGTEYQRFMEEMPKDDIVRTYHAHAIGSALAEKCADYMEKVIDTQIGKLEWRRTNRFSPGYCGWHVSQQSLLFPLFNGETAGVTLTGSNFMMPVKSVSGIIGIGKEVRYNEYSCGLCDYKDCYKRRKKT